MAPFSAEMAFENALDSLEFELMNPGKWSASSRLYYRVRDVALAATELAANHPDDASGEVDLGLTDALEVLRGYVNAHVFAYFTRAPRRPLTRAYAAARIVQRSLRRTISQVSAA
ncbi:MAG: hypothetical protein IPK60_02995 [Sandaracinaceae bacterium]|nr:hypothetical protein [Sandaracinaceae bacterium]